MKVISILQPWASLVVMGLKKIETRSWNTNYRGPLLIHASQGKKKEAMSLFNEWKKSFLYNSEFRGIAFNDLPFGAIIGKVNVAETFATNNIYVIQNGICNHDTFIELDNGSDYALSAQELAFGDYSNGRYGWLLSDPVKFDVPHPAKGSLNLWHHPGVFQCKVCAHEIPLEMALATAEHCPICDPFNIPIKNMI